MRFFPYYRWQDARYSKFENYGPGAENVLPDVRQLTSTEAADYSPAAYFGDWTPRTE